MPKYKRPVQELTAQSVSRINVLSPDALNGLQGFLNTIKRRVQSFGHTAVVADGAGQNLMKSRNGQADTSGNARLGGIGLHLRYRIGESFAAVAFELNVEYLDPSYVVRSVKSNPFDVVFCLRLAYNAVDAVMNGQTEVVVSRWQGRFVLLRLTLAVRDRHVVDPNSDLWLSVLESSVRTNGRQRPPSCHRSRADVAPRPPRSPRFRPRRVPPGLRSAVSRCALVALEERPIVIASVSFRLRTATKRRGSGSLISSSECCPTSPRRVRCG